MLISTDFKLASLHSSYLGFKAKIYYFALSANTFDTVQSVRTYFVHYRLYELLENSCFSYKEIKQLRFFKFKVFFLLSSEKPGP